VHFAWNKYREYNQLSLTAFADFFSRSERQLEAESGQKGSFLSASS
jgi:hypothetical protein